MVQFSTPLIFVNVADTYVNNESSAVSAHLKNSDITCFSYYSSKCCNFQSSPCRNVVMNSIPVMALLVHRRKIHRY
ncbi:Uncharacterized protein BM_BM14301 [Brugia malayi]|uniref:Bm14301 n=1 Tax=Brugia malayi TaxID=6279 RepID=A0A0K0J0S8_BRUMA|nr:Uncharacterized protein BM_BM14301 [Brugia malayi]CDQ00879.1 Bm14301 [Brugia malayi]VIO86617.1 Uncharacterized protein BM_BM14301 [Brugia malayi]